MSYSSSEDGDGCPTCRDLGSNSPTVAVAFFRDFFTYDCPGCAVVLAVLKPYKHLASPRNQIIIGATRLDPTITIKIMEEENSTDSILELELSSVGDTCPWPRIKALENISGDTGSPAALDWVRRKLAECESEHSTCNSPSGPLPTRVIEILGPQQVRLLVTSGQRERYCALSHCWGLQHLITTTTKNINKHKRGIPWASLPKTFQDAIDFQWRLGLKYIWIDSLCIMQDSDADWRREGAKMCDIYQNSYLTPSATKSSDSSQGCFATSDPSYLFRWHTFTDDNGNEYKIGARKRLVHRHFSREPTEPDQLPLLRRGWTLQELLLPPRVLHFNNDELVWECDTAFACECTSIRATSKAGRYFKNHYSSRFNDRGTQPSTWHQIVREYTGRNLTFAKDIFPALQGVATKFQNARQSPYHAGLWEDTILIDLLWSSGWGASIIFAEDDFPHDRPKEWRAPTWSWGSVTGRVGWAADEEFEFDSFQHLRAYPTTVPVGTSYLGQLESAELHLIAPTITVEVSWDIDSSEWHNRQAQFKLTWLGRASNKELSEEWKLRPDYLYDTPGPYQLKSGLRLKVALMAKNKDPVNGCLGLALRVLHVKGSGGMYQRVGLVTFSSSNSFRGAMSVIKGAKTEEFVVL